MTRTTHRRPQTPSGHSRQTNHGHKRKGKPVEAWMMELEKAQDEENGSQSLDLSAIEQIANGVERMVFSWGLDKQERGQEYAKVSKSLAKDTSQMVLPWSLKSNDAGLVAAAADPTAPSEALEISNISAAAAARDAANLPATGRARSPVLAHKSPTRAGSPKAVHSKQTGSSPHGPGRIVCGHMNGVRSSRCLDDFSKERDGPVPPPELALENAHPLAAEFARQSKYDSSCRRSSDSCHGVFTSSNNWLRNSGRQKEEALHVFESRAREDPTCHALTLQQDGLQAGPAVLEARKDNCTSEKNFVAKKEDGENAMAAKDTATLQPSLTGQSPVRATDASAVSVTPRRKDHLRRQQSPSVYHIRNQSLSPMLTQEQSGNESPLLSQSPLCAQSPFARHEALARHASAVLQEGDHAGLFRMTDYHPVDSSCYDNGSGEASSSCLLPYLDSSPNCERDTESVEVGGHTIKVAALRTGNDILENKFQALVNISPGAPTVQDERQSTPLSSNSEVEELQIALLECAMEYEIKTIETKMKMQELKLKGQQNLAVAKSEQLCPQKAIEVSTNQRKLEYQRLQQLKKQMVKLQHEKGALSKELYVLKKKERQFERQKRSLEDALHRVNRLQREVVKKDQEVVEWQLKEKETKAQLQEVGEKLKRARTTQVSQQMEPKKLLTLLPALREWLRSLKKVGLAKAAERRQYQEKDELEVNLSSYPMDGYILQPAAIQGREKASLPGHLGPLGQLSEELANQSNPRLSVNQVDVVICCLTKEIQALQKELTKLART